MCHGNNVVDRHGEQVCDGQQEMVEVSEQLRDGGVVGPICLVQHLSNVGDHIRNVKEAQVSVIRSSSAYVVKKIHFCQQNYESKHEHGLQSVNSNHPAYLHHFDVLIVGCVPDWRGGDVILNQNAEGLVDWRVGIDRDDLAVEWEVLHR